MPKVFHEIGTLKLAFKMPAFGVDEIDPWLSKLVYGAEKVLCKAFIRS